MSAEASAVAGAAYGERSPERTTQRNGYRSRRWDTQTGSIDLRIPKLRPGSYFPDWLLEPRRRAERALVAVIAQAYVEGSGVELVTSDARRGLTPAIAAVLPGAAWQRCRTHLMRNLLSGCPARPSPWSPPSCARFTQSDAISTHRQHATVVEELRSRFPRPPMLEESRDDLLAFTAFSPLHGARSSRTIPRSGTTARSAGGPTSWASSPIATR